MSTAGRESPTPGNTGRSNQCRNFLSTYRYYELLLKLLRWNYRFIPVNAGFLIYCGQKDGYRGGGDFGLALEELGRAETTIESMVSVAAEFLASVWDRLDPPDDEVAYYATRTECDHGEPSAR